MAVDCSCILCGRSIWGGSETACPSCDSPHHHDCWAYMGGCSRYGCDQVRDPRARAAVSLWDMECRLGSLIIEKQNTGLGVRVVGKSGGWWRRPPYLRILPGRIEVKGRSVAVQNVRVVVTAESPPSGYKEEPLGFRVVHSARRVVVLKMVLGSGPSQILSQFDSWRMGLRAAGRLNACLSIAAASL